MRTSIFAIMLAFATPAYGQCNCPEPEGWQNSFTSGSPVTATEVRQFAVYDNKLYAATGSWMDQSSPKGSAHVIRLDSASGQWQDEVNFGDGTTGGLARLRFTAPADYNTKLNPPVDVLTASIWSGATVFSKNLTDGKWYRTNLTSPGQIRSFATHDDAVAKNFWAFAAGKPGIFRGQLNNSRPAGASPITWTTPESKMELRTSNLNLPLCSGGGRVTGMVEARGKLFASVCWRIYQRVDGPVGKCSGPSQVEVGGKCQARWIRFWDDPLAAQGESGLRGLTQVMYQGQQVLLVGSESANMHATRIDPDTGQATVEFNFTTYLRNLWPQRAGYGIIPYNSPAPLWYGPDGAGRRLFGFEVWLPAPPSPDMARKLVNLNANGGGQVMNGEAFFFVRNSATNYQLMQIPMSAFSQPPTAVRDMIASPFPEECNDKGQDCLVYAGVFDANKSTTQTPCTVAPCTVPPLKAVPTQNTGAIAKGKIVLNPTAIAAAASEESEAAPLSAEPKAEEPDFIPDRGAADEGNE